MKQLLLILILSSCSTQYVIVNKKQYHRSATYIYTYTMIDIETKDTVIMDSNKRYCMFDTVQQKVIKL
jgi:hypothetical protein